MALYALSFAGWTEPVRISEPGGCLYPQILAQGDTLHVVYENGSAGSYIGYVRSMNAGNTWSEPVILCDTNETELGEFVKILQFEAKVIAIWRNISNDVRRFNLGYAISLDHGETWGNPLLIFPHNWDRMGYFSAQASDSVISIVISKWVSPDLVFYNLRSTDFGESWSNPSEIFRAYQSDLTDGAAHDSVFHFVWGGRFELGPSWEIYYMRSTDWGLTWSANTLLSEPDDYHSYSAAICANVSGIVGISWMDYKYSPYIFSGDILIRSSFDHGESWGPENQATFNHLALGSDVLQLGDTIHIAYEDIRLGLTSPSIYYLRSDDNGFTWDEEFRLDPDELESRNPALAASNGRVYVIWADDRSYPPADIYPGIYFRRYEEGTSISEEPVNLPQVISLSAYPNPFNVTTIISYANLEGSGGIHILNVLGQVVKTFNIQNGKEGQNGQGQVVWDGTDMGGNPVASGVYFVKARGSSGAVTLKLEYMK